MAEKLSRWVRFKRFLKRNMTPLWAKRFSYQVFAFITAVAMIGGVALYAFTKSYDDRKLTFVDGFTICAHTGAYNTPDNTLDSIEATIKGGADAVEVDVRQRPDGTVVMGHDIITTNSAGVELDTAFALIEKTDLKVNLDIKDTRALSELYKLIVKHKLEKQVFLTGVETFQCEEVAKNCPGIEYYVNYIPSRIKIFSDDYQVKILNMLEETGAVGINCNHTNASRTLSEVLHKNGYKLSVWTVDKEFQMKRALINEPDNITTRKVEELQNLIKNWGKKK